MPLYADVEKLGEAFADVDSRIPNLVFKILRRYCKGDPISIDGVDISHLSEGEEAHGRISPELAAQLHDGFARFFEKSGDRWIPRRTIFAER